VKPANSSIRGHNVVLNLFLQTGVVQLPPGSPAILLIFGIFYFLLFLPMQRQRKQQQKMLAGLPKPAAWSRPAGELWNHRRHRERRHRGVAREARQYQAPGRPQRGISTVVSGEGKK